MKTIEKILRLSSLLLISAGLSHCSNEGPGIQANMPLPMMPTMPIMETKPDPIVYGSPTLTSVMPTSVPNNAISPLTLTGANFRTPAAVTIGGVECTFGHSGLADRDHVHVSRPSSDLRGQSISVTHLDDQKSGELPLPQGLRLTSGSLGFGDAATTVVENGPASIVVGDFDGDQSLDLATANRMTHSVSLARGRGTAVSRTPSTFPSIPIPLHWSSPISTETRSWTSLPANDGGSSVSVLLGDGQGGFAPPSTSQSA